MNINLFVGRSGARLHTFLVLLVKVLFTLLSDFETPWV